MIKPKLILSIICFLGLPLFGQAQDVEDNLSFSTGLVKFASSLKKELANLFDADKVGLMYRKMDYIQQDLTAYLFVRKAAKDILDSGPI